MSRAKNYLDLLSVIEADLGGVPIADIGSILNWIDEHRDQAPGPTMTETELGSVVSDLAVYEGPMKARVRRHLIGLGLTVIPDPKPTNKERLKSLYSEWRSEGPMALAFAEWMDVRGVKAPGGDDGH